MRTRPANDEDRAFILDLARRFAEYELPSWRSTGEVESGTRRWLDQALTGRSDEACILVAEQTPGLRLGLVYVHERLDFFTAQRYGHISEIAVTAPALGTEAATALMRAAEEWARRRGYGRVGLSVFGVNTRARRF